MTREKLEYGLNHNCTVLALWNSENCISCASHMWDVYRAIYSFMDENEFYVLATTVGVDETLDTEYEIDSIEGGTYYRLFVEGSRMPLKRRETEEPEEDDLVTWIAKSTHFAPQHDYVTEITPETYDSYFRKNAHRSIMVMYYLPNFQQSQITLVQYLRAALAFRIEAKVAFARLNCNGHSDFCTEKKVKTIPTFTFYPHKDLAFDGKQLETKRGEGIVLYLNEKLGTQVDPKGGFNEQYGREKELDRLARLFIANKNENQQKRIVKETARLRKRFHATAKYYKIMKAYVKEGPQVIMRELRAVRDGMKGVAFDDPRYATLRARENIIHQFEAINTNHQLVHLNPWSFDSVVNGVDNVVVLFYTSWCEEQAKTLKEDVVLATMDAQTYVDFCAAFHINHFPTVKYFASGKDVMDPVDVPASGWNDIKSFLQETFHETEL
ncbi:hypothetical protein BLSTO_00087 [Blastocystis sp. subtype 1]